MIDPTLLLNVFQSIELNAPVVVELAILIPNTPERLLYVRGPSTEREVSDIFVATSPLRVETVHESELTVPERLTRFPLSVLILPVTEESVPVIEDMFELIPAIVPERAFCALVLVKYIFVPSARSVVDLSPNAVSNRD